ncbi:MarR family winged helix-turn-helix transcriptional regulator [Dactylosporangium sp. CA-092794]|uniref:MarR family winged helix-turn-helix transcriptional regulator n=1 Tax=Dactylosporangium sp. CA-092794 TaxID=3239929 RepID=UPI003D943AB2
MALADGEVRLSVSAATVLAYLAPERRRPKDIARTMGVSRQHVHTALRELIESGMLELVPDPESKRDRIIIVTEAGQAFWERNLTRMRSLEDEFCAGLSADEAARLRTLLARAITSRHP